MSDYSGDIWGSLPVDTSSTFDNGGAFGGGATVDSGAWDPAPSQTWGQWLNQGAAKLPGALKAGAAGLRTGQAALGGDTTNAGNPMAPALALLKGATPARVTQGQGPSLQAVLAELQRRQQAVGQIGFQQQPAGPRPGYSPGLLGI